MSVSTDTQASQHGKPVRTITVTVNRHPVVFEEHKTTGAGIKTTAIAQSVPHIQQNFILSEVKGPGHLKPVGDADPVTLHEGQSFRATAPDDNS